MSLHPTTIPTEVVEVREVVLNPWVMLRTWSMQTSEDDEVEHVMTADLRLTVEQTEGLIQALRLAAAKLRLRESRQRDDDRATARRRRPGDLID